MLNIMYDFISNNVVVTVVISVIVLCVVYAMYIRYNSNTSRNVDPIINKKGSITSCTNNDSLNTCDVSSGCISSQNLHTENEQQMMMQQLQEQQEHQEHQEHQEQQEKQQKQGQNQGQ